MSVLSLVVRFTLAGLLVIAVLATVIAALARQSGTEQAIDRPSSCLGNGAYG